MQKVVGTRADYTREELISFMRAKILEYVPDLLGKQIVREQISVLKVSAYLSEFSKAICDQLVEHFDSFGLTLDNFSFHNINVPDEDLRIINEAKIQRKRRASRPRATPPKWTSNRRPGPGCASGRATPISRSTPLT